jgi:transcriptional regulator with XRE-family HTH domain
MNDNTRNFIRKKLDEAGVSQVELAERLSMTPSHVSRLLSGERDTTLENLLTIADVLRIERSFLLRLASGLPPEPGADAWVDETSHKIKLIAPNLRSVVSSFINSLLDGSEAPPAKPKPNHKHKTTTP